MYDFKNLEQKERIYKYWNHSPSGEPICFAIDKYFKDSAEFSFVELGCQLGGLSDLVLHEFNNSYIYAIDIVNHSPQLMTELNKNRRFSFIEGSSLDEHVYNRINQIDFLYIDTDPHKEDQLKKEMEIWIPKVKINGIVAFHDYNHPNHPDVKRVVDEYCKQNNLTLFFLDYYNVYFQKSHADHFYKSVEGFFNFEDVYEEAVRSSNDNSHFVEIGSFLGCSTVFMAVEIINSRKKIKFDAVDKWDFNWKLQTGVEVNTYNHFIENIFPVKQFINPIKLASTEAAKLYKDQSLDFVFIDADHEYPGIKADIEAWYPKVKTGGVFAGHDYYHTFPGVIQAVDEFLGDDKLIKGTSWWHII